MSKYTVPTIFTMPNYNSAEFSSAHCDMVDTISKVTNYITEVTFTDTDILDALARMARCSDTSAAWVPVLTILKNKCNPTFVSTYLSDDVDNFIDFYKNLVKMNRTTVLDAFVRQTAGAAEDYTITM